MVVGGDCREMEPCKSLSIGLGPFPKLLFVINVSILGLLSAGLYFCNDQVEENIAPMDRA